MAFLIVYLARTALIGMQLSGAVPSAMDFAGVQAAIADEECLR